MTSPFPFLPPRPPGRHRAGPQLVPRAPQTEAAVAMASPVPCRPGSGAFRGRRGPVAEGTGPGGGPPSRSGLPATAALWELPRPERLGRQGQAGARPRWLPGQPPVWPGKAPRLPHQKAGTVAEGLGGGCGAGRACGLAGGGPGAVPVGLRSPPAPGCPVQACRGPHALYLGPDRAAELGGLWPILRGPGPLQSINRLCLSGPHYPAVPVTPSPRSVISPDAVRGRLGPGGSADPAGETPHVVGVLSWRWELAVSPVEVAEVSLLACRAGCGEGRAAWGHPLLLRPGPFSPFPPASHEVGWARHGAYWDAGVAPEQSLLLPITPRDHNKINPSPTPVVSPSLKADTGLGVQRKE